MVPTSTVAQRANTSISSDAQARFAGLLGFPQQLDPNVVADRRELLIGQPLTSQEIDAAGAPRELAGDTFALNVADLLVDNTVNALNVVALRPADEGQEQAAELLWQLWQESHLGEMTQGLFTAACCDGQAFLIADFGADGRPRAHVNAAYDGRAGVEVKDVDAEGRLRVAIKHEVETLARDRQQPTVLQRVVDWFLAAVGRPREHERIEFVERRRRTLYAYDPDTDATVVRFFIRDPGRDEAEVTEGDEPVGEGYRPPVWPYGMPVVPFVSPDGGELTEMETPQRLVNRAALDLAVASQIDALRMPYTLDCEPLAGGQELSSTAQTGVSGLLQSLSQGTSSTDPVRIQPGVFLELSSRTGLDGMAGGGSIGVLPGSDLLSHRENLKLWIELAMLVGRAPVHHLPWNALGTPPSGASLYLSTAPFREKIESYQERWSTAFASLFTVWQRMLGQEPVMVAPVWRRQSATVGIEKLQEATIAMELGLPETYIGEEILGMDPPSVAAWTEAREAAKAEQLAMMEAMDPPAGEKAEV